MTPPAPSGHRLAAIAQAPADPERRLEQRAHADPAGQPVRADRREACRRDAAALRAVRVAAELAGRNAVLEVRGDARRRLREDALVRTFGRGCVLLHEPGRHGDLLVLQYASPPESPDE